MYNVVITIKNAEIDFSKKEAVYFDFLMISKINPVPYMTMKTRINEIILKAYIFQNELEKMHSRENKTPKLRLLKSKTDNNIDKALS
jgi:hypothetical protein